MRASFYTIGAYIIIVLILTFRYLILKNYYISLGYTLCGAVLIIAVFTYYTSVERDLPFKRHFLEMAGLSFAVAAFSFIVGYIMRAFLGVDL